MNAKYYAIFCCLCGAIYVISTVFKYVKYEKYG